MRDILLTNVMCPLSMDGDRRTLVSDSNQEGHSLHLFGPVKNFDERCFHVSTEKVQDGVLPAGNGSGLRNVWNTSSPRTGPTNTRRSPLQSCNVQRLRHSLDLLAGWLICITAASVSFRAIETACLTERKRTFCTTGLFRFIPVVLPDYRYAAGGFNRTVAN